ncbi:MAG: citrate lyase acyl carrier protein [Eubacteriales bacterium]
MVISQSAVSGTLESSDVLITIEPASGFELSLDSTVSKQYGRAITQCVKDVCAELSVDAVKVTVVDRGALDCTIRARLQSALCRGAELSPESIQWKEVIR